MKAVRLKQIAFIATLGFTAIWFRFRKFDFNYHRLLLLFIFPAVE